MSLRSRSESPLVGAAEDLLRSEVSRCPLSNAQLARKRAEQDSVLLANRLRLLRAEEEKTRKKVLETEKKTQEILELQQRNEERRLAKEAEESRREVEEQLLRERQLQERADQQRTLEKRQKTILEQKCFSSASVRQDREAGRLEIEEQRAEIEAMMMAKAERARRQSAAASRSRAKSEGAKKEAAKSFVRERIMREEEERRIRVSAIEQMEGEEAELIARLQQTQERHRVAFLKLEDALAGHGSVSHALAGPASSSSIGPASSSSIGSAPSSSNTALPFQSSTGFSRSATPAAQAAADAAIAAFHAAGSSSSSTSARPPRPRGLPADSASGKPGASRRTGATTALTPKHSVRALSSCSTASGEAESGRATPALGIASGQSTPSSAAAPQITYTTADGLQLDIPVEEDLDLASLLNA